MQLLYLDWPWRSPPVLIVPNLFHSNGLARRRTFALKASQWQVMRRLQICGLLNSLLILHENLSFQEYSPSLISPKDKNILCLILFRQILIDLDHFLFVTLVFSFSEVGSLRLGLRFHDFRTSSTLGRLPLPVARILPVAWQTVKVTELSFKL